MMSAFYVRAEEWRIFNRSSSEKFRETHARAAFAESNLFAAPADALPDRSHHPSSPTSISIFPVQKHAARWRGMF